MVTGMRHGERLLQRLVARGYDRVVDRIDPPGGADHRRRLVEEASGEMRGIGAGTGRILPRHGNATRVVALEPTRRSRPGGGIGAVAERRTQGGGGTMPATSARGAKRVSNQRFRQAAGWEPRYPSVEAGWPTVAAPPGSEPRQVP